MLSPVGKRFNDLIAICVYGVDAKIIATVVLLPKFLTITVAIVLVKDNQ